MTATSADCAEFSLAPTVTSVGVIFIEVLNLYTANTCTFEIQTMERNIKYILTCDESRPKKTVFVDKRVILSDNLFATLYEGRVAVRHGFVLTLFL